MDIDIKIILEIYLNQKERSDIKLLNKECFGNISQQEIDEDFIAENFAVIIAYLDNKAVGTLRLFKRNITFANKNIILGGMGGVCVSDKYRRKGVATAMLQKGLDLLKKENCDVACLNVDLTKKAYKVYERLGFKFMERKFSFTNSKGVVKYDTGTMFIPINSKDIYNLIMNSKETFHYGVGYW